MKTILEVFLLAFLTIAIVAVPLELGKAYQCNSYQEITGRESKYVTLDACYVKKDNGEWTLLHYKE